MTNFRIIHTTIPGRKGPAVSKENQDRVLVRRVRRDGSSLFLVGIADGISRCPCGGRVAEYLMGKHLKRDRMFTRTDPGPARQLEEYLERLNTQFYEEFIDHPKMLASGATMSIGLLENDTAHHYWVGDSPILIARRDDAGFHVSQLSIPDVCGRLLTDCFGADAPFRIKKSKVGLERGDVFVIASDGAVKDAELFREMLNEYGVTRRLLQMLRKLVTAPEYFDDASIVLVERTR
jgi:serine/threonine protein phosphatase PrpC